MKSQALICNEEQEFSLEAFEIPPLAPADLLVRCTYSGVSVGTEFAVFRRKLDYGPFPVCTGYQAVGIVEAVGSDVTRFEVGDKVYYRRNFMPMWVDGRPVTICSGVHASYTVLPQDAEIERLPAGVDDATGSLFVMPSVGYNAVDMAGVQMGDVAAFHAVGMIGLGALAAARLRGAITIAIDLNPRRLEMAKSLGASYVIDVGGLAADEVKARVEEIKPGGADIVFEGSGIPRCLDLAFPLARLRGKFVFLGHYGKDPVSFNYLIPHSKQLTAFFPCNDGLEPCREAVLRNLATGAIPWQKTITHRVTGVEAPDLYASINRDEIPDLFGAVIHWS
ncbi:MAG: zinc-binding dehydrogenase [Caldilineaceae bacterium]|nr:zinc-binding dehydrogenase [Caldilineaceae bacterium]